MSPQVDAMALSIAAEAMPNPLIGALAAFKLKLAALTSVKLFGTGTSAAAATAGAATNAAVERSAQAASAAAAAASQVRGGVKDLAAAAARAKATAGASGFMAQHGQFALQPDADAVMKLRDIQRATLEGITRDMQHNLPV